MYLSKAIWGLVLGLAFASCSKQDPEASLTKPTMPTASNILIPGPTEPIEFAADLALEGGGLRALEGTKFYRGRLRPKITGGTIPVRVYLGSKTRAQLSPLTLDFNYNEETNSIHYRGKINVPDGLIEAADLRLLMLVTNDGQITTDNSKIDITSTIKTAFYDNGAFADGTALDDMKVPYSTGWLDVSGLATPHKKLDVARTKVLLKPLGSVIKLEVDVNQSALEEVTFQGFRIESTAITDKGSYALPQNHNQIGEPGANLPFTPVLGSKNSKIGTFELLANEEVIVKASPKSKTVFVWVEQIPQTSLQAPYNSRAERWTRTFVKFKKSKPVLDHSYANGWWDGFEGTMVPAYYTKSDFSKTGSTMAMELDNPKVVSQIDRFSPTYMGKTFASSNRETMQDNVLGLGAFAQREMRYYSHYTYSWLEQQNYVGDARVPIVIADAPDPNARAVKFRIPTLEEFATIIPTDPAVGQAMRLRWHNGQPIDIDSERVKLGGVGSSPASYSATYQTYSTIPGATTGFTGALAVRFKGRDDRHKTLFQYRLLDASGQGAKVQIQTFYLGGFYPEINTPREFEEFIKNYPDASHTVNQNPMSERMLMPDAPRLGNFKNRYWVASPAPNPDQATYVEYNYHNGTNPSVMVGYETKTDQNKKYTVVLIRDF